MNILIKNADFSEVSIGRVDPYKELEQECVLTKIYSESNKLYYINNSLNLKLVAFDVSSYNLKVVKITGVKGSPIFACFFNAECPTTDRTFSSQEEVNSFETSLGSRLSNFNPEVSGTVTATTTIPNGAKTLLVYAGSELPSVCNVEVQVL